MKKFLVVIVSICALLLGVGSASAASTPFAFKSFVNKQGNAEVLIISKTDKLYFKNIIPNDGKDCVLPKVGLDPRWGNHALTFNEEKSFFFASTVGARHCGIHKLVFITNMGEFEWSDPEYVRPDVTPASSTSVSDEPTPPSTFSDSAPSDNRTDVLSMEVSGNTVLLSTKEESVTISSVVLSEQSVDIGKEPVTVTPNRTVKLRFNTDLSGQVIWILTNYGPVEKKL